MPEENFVCMNRSFVATQNHGSNDTHSTLDTKIMAIQSCRLKALVISGFLCMDKWFTVFEKKSQVCNVEKCVQLSAINMRNVFNSFSCYRLACLSKLAITVHLTILLQVILDTLVLQCHFVFKKASSTVIMATVKGLS